MNRRHLSLLASKLSAVLMTSVMASTVIFGLASCGSDKDNNGVPEPEKKSNVLRLRVSVDNSLSRAAATINGDAESKVNHLTVGIFDNTTGKLKMNITDRDVSNNEIYITDEVLTDGDSILVAVNTPENTFGDLKVGSSTTDDFRNTTLDIRESLYHNGTEETPRSDNLPMFGEGTMSSTSSYTLESSITVYRLVAKVTLSSLKVEFQNDGAYSNAKFQPTEIFLDNVPDRLNFFLPSSGENYCHFAKPIKFVTGEQTTEGPKGEVVTPSNYPYLSTDRLSAGGYPVNSKPLTEYAKSLPVFYTLPNKEELARENGASLLVIKGILTNNGKSDITYYPVFINMNTDSHLTPDGGISKVVSPNVNYKINITITGEGSDSPFHPAKSGSVNVTMTVAKWVASTSVIHF